MGLEKSIIHYEGKIEILNQIKKDFQKFNSNSFNGKEIDIIAGDAIIIQPHNQNDILSSVQIPDKATGTDVDYTNGKIIFNYNEKRYLISKEKRFYV